MVTTPPTPSAPETSGTRDAPLDVVIIGAGFSGICMGIQLRKSGMDNFVIFEKSSAVSGTWHDHTYPGLVCDIPSHLYSYSFAPNPQWSRAFSPQIEIKAYVERCVSDFRLTSHLRLNTEITRVPFLQELALWLIEKSNGEMIHARVVVSACGGLRIPQIPDFLDSGLFLGQQFHTATWPADFDPKNQRIAIVGSAASAVQILPELAKSAKQIYLFQRTPNYIMPRGDRAFSAGFKKILNRNPWMMRGIRWVLFCFLDFILFRSFFLKSAANLRRERAALEHMHSQVSNKDLQEKLTPGYPIGCKRVILSDDFYPALNRENVRLVTEPIERLSEVGVVTQQTELLSPRAATEAHPVDAIIFATGYDVTSPTGHLRVEGLDGASLRQAWTHGMTAHRGVAMSGFPNLFFVVGPNSGLGHNSIVFIIEQQVNYIIKCIKRLRPGESMMVKESAMLRYNEGLRKGFQGKVWTGGCESWYMDASGHNPVLWPYRSLSYWRAMRRPDFGEYEFTS